MYNVLDDSIQTYSCPMFWMIPSKHAAVRIYFLENDVSIQRSKRNLREIIIWTMSRLLDRIHDGQHAIGNS